MAETIVRAAGVRKSYRDGLRETPVLKGIDLSVRAGEFLAVVGPSGSGKSTFLHILGLMDEPTSGEVFLMGSDTRSLPEEAKASLRNKNIGFVFQFDSLLPEFTVLENASLPGRIGGTKADARRAEGRAREVLGLFGMERFADRFPQELSGGERQRAAVARALFNRPSILLADEPTGNLDRGNGELVFNALKEVSGRLGTAVVMVTHSESAARFASRVLEISDGLIAAKDGGQ